MTTCCFNEFVVEEARSWIGTPYVHQCSVKGRGCDCLGLIRGIWRALYGHEPQNVPAYSPHWDEISKKETLLTAAREHLVQVPRTKMDAGSVLLFRWNRNSVAKHVGIQSRPGFFIHAYEKCGVVETILAKQYQSRVVGVFQFPPLGRG